MATKNITFRLDETLKKQAELIYSSMGLNMSSALQMFVTQTVTRGCIPFTIEADEDAKYRAYVLREISDLKRDALSQDYDAFVLAELEKSKREADDPDTERLTHNDVMKNLAKQREERHGL